jgi:hypothetical protein
MPGNQQFREETDEEFLARLAERHAQKAARRTARIARLEAAGVLVLPLPKRGRLANARKADL